MGIAAFRSRQQVQYFQNLMNQQGLWATVINTPHQVAIGCGVSVQFDLKDLAAVKRIYENHRASLVSLVGFYAAQRAGTQLEVHRV